MFVTYIKITAVTQLTIMKLGVLLINFEAVGIIHIYI